ncbi:MAG: hypothetical protein HYS35_08100 [Betaproteobacteria bacterium]|nr:hypothetical protein [Betaproteobacteria bacterium]
MTDEAKLEGLRAWTHVIYALHAWSVLAGILTPALVVTMFLLGWPSLIAVVLNYVKRAEAAGTALASHFRWQIRTFWFALPWTLVGIVLWFTLLLIPLAILVWVLTGLWITYRVARGWIALVQGKPMPMPQASNR